MLKKYNPSMAEQMGQVCKVCFLSASLLHRISQSLHRTIHMPWQLLAKHTVIFFKRLNTSAKMENASPVDQNI